MSRKYTNDMLILFWIRLILRGFLFALEQIILLYYGKCDINIPISLVLRFVHTSSRNGNRTAWLIRDRIASIVGMTILELFIRTTYMPNHSFSGEPKNTNFLKIYTVYTFFKMTYIQHTWDIRFFHLKKKEGFWKKNNLAE